MNHSKRAIKESQIIDAAEKVFSLSGYRNAKMEDVAKTIGVSKGTVYFYFSSKENLYMAVTHKAYQLFLDEHYKTLQAYEGKSGFETVDAIINTCLTFAQDNPYYYDLITQYIQLVRSMTRNDGVPQAEEIQKSIYFRKIQDIQFLPLNMTVKEIQRGQQEGSIANPRNPVMIYLTSWAMVIGFGTLNIASSGAKDKTLLRVPVLEWQKYVKKMLRDMLNDDHEGEYVDDLAIPKRAELR
ncbi:MAG: helix-turn-helix domain-containing protein [Bacteroidota bacterium]